MPRAKTIKRSAARVEAATAGLMRRRSPRLQARSASTSAPPVSPEVPAAAAASSRLSKSKSKSKRVIATSASTSDAAPLTFPHGTLPRAYEAKREAEGYSLVLGVDEAGRGPLAGPVVAAACHVPLDVTIEGIHDSKKLSEPQREALFDILTSHPRVRYAVHANSAQRIDEINILQASLESMTKAVEAVVTAAKTETADTLKTFVLVDGNRLPPTLALPAEAVVKGDSKAYSIAAASVLAKVTRDRLMRDYDVQFPQYGLAQHKGYPTKAHMAAIARHGPCAIHRLTFAPLKPKTTKKPKKT